jgi:sigma-B regulation protein RsbQ
MQARSRNNVNVVGATASRRSCSRTASGAIRTYGGWSSPNFCRISGCAVRSCRSGAADPTAWDAARYASLRGYADDILEILSALDLRDVTFVGHSVAAMMGVLAVGTDPSRIAKAGAADSIPVLHRRRRLPRRLLPRRHRRLLESLESNYLGWSRAMAPVIMGAPERPELADELADTFCRTDPECARVFARATFLSDNRTDLKRVSVPTLVIECERDAIAPREVGAYVHRHIGGSELVTLNTTGHCPHLSAPEATARAIGAFAGAT